PFARQLVLAGDPAVFAPEGGPVPPPGVALAADPPVAAEVAEEERPDVMAGAPQRPNGRRADVNDARIEAGARRKVLQTYDRPAAVQVDDVCGWGLGRRRVPGVAPPTPESGCAEGLLDHESDHREGKRFAGRCW